MVFSVKAALEAFRDLILIPIALGAGVIGLIFQRDDPGALFRPGSARQAGGLHHQRRHQPHRKQVPRTAPAHRRTRQLLVMP